MVSETLHALAGLITQTPAAVIARDLLSFAHLLVFAGGLGSVIVTDLSLLVSINRVFDRDRLRAIHRGHAIITAALVGLWITGLGLALIATGGNPAAASPKLVAKLATVAMLTLTAFAMGTVGLTLLQQAVGTRLPDLPLRTKLTFATLAGMSLGGWSTATLLGAAKTTLEASATAAAGVLLTTHGSTVMALIVVVLAQHFGARLVRRARQQAAVGEAPAL